MYYQKLWRDKEGDQDPVAEQSSKKVHFTKGKTEQNFSLTRFTQKKLEDQMANEKPPNDWGKKHEITVCNKKRALALMAKGQLKITWAGEKQEGRSVTRSVSVLHRKYQN